MSVSIILSKIISSKTSTTFDLAAGRGDRRPPGYYINFTGKCRAALFAALAASNSLSASVAISKACFKTLKKSWFYEKSG